MPIKDNDGQFNGRFSGLILKNLRTNFKIYVYMYYKCYIKTEFH